MKLCGILYFFFLVGTVASWLVRSTPEGAVLVRALAGDIVICSSARCLTLTVCLFQPSIMMVTG